MDQPEVLHFLLKVDLTAFQFVAQRNNCCSKLQIFAVGSHERLAQAFVFGYSCLLQLISKRCNNVLELANLARGIRRFHDLPSLVQIAPRRQPRNGIRYPAS